jgi:hypothetical protein
MAWHDTKITCPKCLKKLDSDVLQNDTEYGCWDSEEVTVDCYECNFSFDVRCDHAGWVPRDDFDIVSFVKAHNIVIPDELTRIYVTHHLSEFAQEGYSRQYAPENFSDQNTKWKEAYEFARKEWDRIQNEIHGSEDEDDFVG